MPDPDSKKASQKKGKSEPREQRKPRQQRGQPADKKHEKKVEDPKVPEKPAYEEPGPDFYKGLKRETDDILKITEEANSKYKKKEIQSNWAKYEIPIESYDEKEEQENMGADYEKLIEAPLSIGGHFQFKHEKSWDITTGPSLYDKYFDINMNDLATALCTIPFYERNDIDKTIFSDADIQTMDQRTNRHKHKYFKIATTESEIQDKLIKSLKEDYSKSEEDTIQESESLDSEPDDKILANEINLNCAKSENTKAENENHDNIEMVFKRPHEELIVEAKVDNLSKPKDELVDNIDDILGANKTATANEKLEVKKVIPVHNVKVIEKASPAPAAPQKAPVIESPEDLEKWLDDFLEE